MNFAAILFGQPYGIEGNAAIAAGEKSFANRMFFRETRVLVATVVINHLHTLFLYARSGAMDVINVTFGSEADHIY